ncbi:hypothetical protein ACUOA5_25845, partial [Escherichia coli]
ATKIDAVQLAAKALGKELSLVFFHYRIVIMCR